MSLAGDGIDTVVKANAAVDKDPKCRNKVSCANILALATRDIVNLDVKVNVIMTDYSMPRMTGCELLKKIKMFVQECCANTLLDLLERVGRASSRLTTYRFPVKQQLRPALNHEPVSDPNCKLKMVDVVELTPAIPHKTEYREEIQRMYDRGLTVSSMGTTAVRSSMVGTS